MTCNSKNDSVHAIYKHKDFTANMSGKVITEINDSCEKPYVKFADVVNGKVKREYTSGLIETVDADAMYNSGLFKTKKVFGSSLWSYSGELNDYEACELYLAKEDKSMDSNKSVKTIDNVKGYFERSGNYYLVLDTNNSKNEYNVVKLVKNSTSKNGKIRVAYNGSVRSVREINGIDVLYNVHIRSDRVDNEIVNIPLSDITWIREH